MTPDSTTDPEIEDQEAGDEEADTSPEVDSAAGQAFGPTVLLGAFLFVPAALLVFHGNLSVYDALLRFGCALAVASIGTAVIRSALPPRPVRAVVGAIPCETPEGPRT